MDILLVILRKNVHEELANAPLTITISLNIA